MSRFTSIIGASVVAGVGLIYAAFWFASQSASIAQRLDAAEIALAAKPDAGNAVTSNISVVDDGLGTSIKQQADSIAALNQQMMTLTRQLNDVMERLDADQPTSELPTLDDESKSPEQLEQDRQQYIVDAKRESAERKRKEADDFYSESVDEIWAQDTQVKLQESFAKPDLEGVEMTFSECRSSRCVVRWRIDPNLSELDKFEKDNNILIEAGAAGMDTTVFLEPLAEGEFHAIFKRSDTRTR